MTTTPATRPLQPREIATPAPLVVAMIVDQLGAWMVEERIAELPKSGGFARLRREGLYAHDMRYAHAVTETAPAHAALFTGAPPNRSGIYANELIDVRTRAPMSALRDPSVQTLTEAGTREPGGISIAGLQAETVADVLRKRAPHATIISVSLKDRGAAFGGGHKPDATLWYDARRDGFVTSSTFAAEYPAWAAKAMPASEIRQLRVQPWNLLDPVFVASHAKQADAQTGESDVFGFGVAFPHDFAASKRPALAFRASPRGDEAVLDLAVAALEQRRASEPMLLAISLSSLDYVGHYWGADSWEAWDELLRLDAALASFFATLDRAVGDANWSLVLSGDHGAPTLPEAPEAARPWCTGIGSSTTDKWERSCRISGRIFPGVLADKLQAEAEKALGKGDWVLGVASPYVFYTQSAAALPDDRRRKLDLAVTHALLTEPEVDRVYPSGGEATCPAETDESIDALVCRSLSPKNKAGLYVVLKKGSFVDTDYDLGRGMSHGGPYLFDRSVPLFVRIGGQPRPAEITKPIGFASYTRTLATLLGVPAPASASAGEDFAHR